MWFGGTALAALAVAVVLVVRAARDSERLVAGGPPAFNLVYAPSAFAEAPAQDGELARIEGRRRAATVTLTVRRVEVPPYGDGDVVGGFLPLLAEERIAELEEQYGGIGVYDEGKARINELPGYQIGFDARDGDRRVYGRDAYVFPDDPAATEGVLLSMRRVVTRRDASPAAEEFADLAKEAFASFAFGADRP